MAQIVTITNPLTGQPAQVDQLEHTAQQIDEGINIARGVSNPNLFDNWYFGNPVNQRGVSGSIQSAGYFLDRWKKKNSAGTIGITDNGITWTFDSSDDNDIDQLFEKPGYIGKGTQVTFSALVDGKVYSVSFKWLETNGVNVNGLSGMRIFSIESRHIIIRFTSSWVSSRVIRAVKLEKGEISTLANDVSPNYQQELAKCQRYFQTFATESLRPANALDFRPVMRANPALSTITVNGKTLYTASADL